MGVVAIRPHQNPNPALMSHPRDLEPQLEELSEVRLDRVRNSGSVAGPGPQHQAPPCGFSFPQPGPAGPVPRRHRYLRVLRLGPIFTMGRIARAIISALEHFLWNSLKNVKVGHAAFRTVCS